MCSCCAVGRLVARCLVWEVMEHETQYMVLEADNTELVLTEIGSNVQYEG